MSSISRRAVLRGGLAAGVVATAGRTSAASAAVPSLVRAGRPVLPHGVQSGDVSVRSAVVWTQADRPSRMVVEVSRDPDFRRRVRRLHGPVLTPDTDLTGRVRLRALPVGA